MEIDNWVAWLQARIPELKDSHNAFWVKQALEGYSLEAEKKALDTSSVVGQSEQLFCVCLNNNVTDFDEETGIEFHVECKKRIAK